MTTTYSNGLQSFDHAELAALDAYLALRRALADFAGAAQAVGACTLSGFLEALQDMGLSTPFPADCPECGDRAGPMKAWQRPRAWPYAVERYGGSITATYRCPRCAGTWQAEHLIAGAGRIE